MSIRIEPPRPLGEEIEVFVQEAAAGTVGCTAHIHHAVELLYICRGSYTVDLDGEHVAIREGDLILFCSNAIHSVRAGECAENSYLVIKIPPDFLFQLAPREVAVEYVTRFALARRGRRYLWRAAELSDTPMGGILAELMREWREASPLGEITVRLRVLSLLVEILRSDAPEPTEGGRAAEVMYRAILFVRTHFAEDVDEGALSESLGMSYSYFSRCFRRTAGMPFRQYLNLTRIREAERMLLAPEPPAVSEVATACGYNSVSYFISTFRTVTGVTPASFSRQNR